MKYTFVLLILCAGCTIRKAPTSVPISIPTSPNPSASSPAEKTTEKTADKEMQKITHWFEQMDAVWRESLWVIKKERPPQSKSIFGKMQRALLIEAKQKLANKSLFSCDSYSMQVIRDIPVAGQAFGFPKSANVFHKCAVREGFSKIGNWSHSGPSELEVDFQANNLTDVVGVATAIFNPKMHCKLKSNELGMIQSFSCDNLMVDYNPQKNQVLKFTRFEFEKSGTQILHLRAQVLENLEAVRKIESDVPLDGVIEVTETVLKAPYVAPVETPVPVAAPTPLIHIGVPSDPNTPIDPNAQAGGSIRPSQVPVRPGGRGTVAPIPAEQLGVPGAPVVPGAPPEGPDYDGRLVPGALPGAAPGAPPAQSPDEGEYHEGEPLPNTR